MIAFACESWLEDLAGAPQPHTPLASRHLANHTPHDGALDASAAPPLTLHALGAALFSAVLGSALTLRLLLGFRAALALFFLLSRHPTPCSRAMSRHLDIDGSDSEHDGDLNAVFGTGMTSDDDGPKSTPARRKSSASAIQRAAQAYSDDEEEAPRGAGAVPVRAPHDGERFADGGGGRRSSRDGYSSGGDLDVDEEAGGRGEGGRGKGKGKAVRSADGGGGSGVRRSSKGKGKAVRRPDAAARRSPRDYDDEEDDRWDSRGVGKFDEAEEEPADGPAKKKPKRGKNGALDEDAAQESAVRFLVKMMDARDEDFKSFKRGQPALAKLRDLPEVERMLCKVDYRAPLLTNGLLSVIKAWLDPMPDRSLPNLRVRQVLLAALDAFPVDEGWTDLLRSSTGLGKVIHYLSRHDDFEANKRLARKLMDKWSRPIFDMSTDYSHLNADYERVAAPERNTSASGAAGFARNRTTILETGRDRRASVAQHLQTERVGDAATAKMMAKRDRAMGDELKNVVRVPQRVSFSFTRVPESSSLAGEGSASGAGGTASGTRKKRSLDKAVKGMKRKTQSRAVNVSIEGRDLH